MVSGVKSPSVENFKNLMFFFGSRFNWVFLNWLGSRSFRSNRLVPGMAGSRFASVYACYFRASLVLWTVKSLPQFCAQPDRNFQGIALLSSRARTSFGLASRVANLRQHFFTFRQPDRFQNFQQPDRAFDTNLITSLNLQADHQPDLQ